MKRFMIVTILLLSGCDQTTDEAAIDEPAAAEKTLPFDPLANQLPAPVQGFIAESYPGHCVWEVKQDDPAAAYQVLLFDPESTGMHHYTDADGVSHIRLINYLLVIKSEGEIVEEQPHPIPESIVPRQALAVYRDRAAGFPRKVLEKTWYAAKESGKSREFRARVLFNSIHSYEARFDSTGKLLTEDANY